VNRLSYTYHTLYYYIGGVESSDKHDASIDEFVRIDEHSARIIKDTKLRLEGDMTPPDTLNSIGILKRREIEARMLAPIIEALSQKFDRTEVIETVRDTIISIAQQQGARLADEFGGCSLAHFEETLQYWTKDDALRIDVVSRTADEFGFNVTRCRYAELYRSLGIPELGAVLSCNRDYALIEGFNSDVTLTRTQTIMQGATHCDFRYQMTPAANNSHDE